MAPCRPASLINCAERATSFGDHAQDIAEETEKAVEAYKSPPHLVVRPELRPPKELQAGSLQGIGWCAAVGVHGLTCTGIPNTQHSDAQPSPGAGNFLSADALTHAMTQEVESEVSRIRVTTLPSRNRLSS